MFNKLGILLDKLLDLSWLSKDKKQTKWEKFRLWFALILIIVFFGYLFYKAWGGLGQILSNGLHFDFGYLFLSLVCQIIGLSIAVYVWGDILKFMDVPSSFIFNYEVYCVSAIARKIPGGIWYAFSRVAAYSYLKKSKWLVFVAVIVESLISILSGGFNIGISILGGYSDLGWKIHPILIGGSILILLILIIFLSPRIIRYFVNRNLSQGNNDFTLMIQIKSWDVTRWVFLESIVLMFATGVGYFLLKAIDPNQNPPFFLMSGSFNLGVALSPIAMWIPGNVGVRDSLIYLALRTSIGDALAALITLAWRVWVYILEVGAGTICGIDFKRRISVLFQNNSQQDEA